MSNLQWFANYIDIHHGVIHISHLFSPHKSVRTLNVGQHAAFNYDKKKRKVVTGDRFPGVDNFQRIRNFASTIKRMAENPRINTVPIKKNLYTIILRVEGRV